MHRLSLASKEGRIGPAQTTGLLPGRSRDLEKPWSISCCTQISSQLFPFSTFRIRLPAAFPIPVILQQSLLGRDKVRELAGSGAGSLPLIWLYLCLPKDEQGLFMARLAKGTHFLLHIRLLWWQHLQLPARLSETCMSCGETERWKKCTCACICTWRPEVSIFFFFCCFPPFCSGVVLFWDKISH